LVQAVLEHHDVLLEVEDALDPGEVDALALREVLHLEQAGHVAAGVAPSAATGPPRHDQSEPVVLAQRLRVQPRELRGLRDRQHGCVVGDHVDLLRSLTWSGGPALTVRPGRPARRARPRRRPPRRTPPEPSSRPASASAAPPPARSRARRRYASPPPRRGP